MLGVIGRCAKPGFRTPQTKTPAQGRGIRRRRDVGSDQVPAAFDETAAVSRVFGCRDRLPTLRSPHLAQAQRQPTWVSERS